VLICGVCLGVCTLVNEVSAVVNGAVFATFRVEMPLRSSAITDDRSAGFDPCIYNGIQSVSGPVRNGNEKRFIGLALNSTEHTLPLNRVAPMIFAPNELPYYDRLSSQSNCDDCPCTAARVWSRYWSITLQI